MPTLHFSVTGESLTNFFRDRVLEEAWQDALNGMVDSLQGFTYEHAISVLNGEKKLIGDSNIGIDIVDDKESAHYLENLDYLVGKTYKDGKYSNKHWEICGEFHAIYARDYYHLALNKNPNMLLPSMDDIMEAYLFEKNHINDFLSIAYKYIPNDHKVDFVKVGEKGRFIVSKPTYKIPMWINVSKDIKTALEKTSHIRQFGPDIPDENDLKSPLKSINFDDLNQKEAPIKKRFFKPAPNQIDDDFDLDEEIKNYKIKIKEQADISKEGWFTLKVPKVNSEEILEYKIPKAPFVYFAINRTRYLKDQGLFVKELPKWDPVCPSGLKLQNDDPYHTDWMIAADLELNALYEYNEQAKLLDEAVFDEINKIEEEYYIRKPEITVLCGTGIATGVVVRLTEDRKCSFKEIAVVPSASPEWMLAAQTAGAVLVAAGGKMAHLVTETRANRGKIARLPKHIHKNLRNNQTIRVDFEDNTIVRLTL